MLTGLSIANVRCIEAAEATLEARCTLVTGANGSGKTALLEAIHLLSGGRTFRSGGVRGLVRRGADGLTVVGRWACDQVERTVGFGFGPRGAQLRWDGIPVVSASEGARRFPVSAIGPDVGDLFEGGARERRRRLDWLLFHVEPGYGGVWQRYHRALRQALVAVGRDAGAAQSFIREASAAGETLTSSRSWAVEALDPLLQARARALGGRDLRISLNRGWDGNRTLAEALTEQLAAGDIARVAGPHRADLQARCEGISLRRAASRGELKLAAVAFEFASIDLMRARGVPSPLLLLDDLPAELDPAACARLGAEVTALDCQSVVTGTTEAWLAHLPDAAVFHVERGRFRARMKPCSAVRA